MEKIQAGKYVELVYEIFVVNGERIGAPEQKAEPAEEKKAAKKK